MNKRLVALILAFASTPAAGGDVGLHLATGVMALMNSTKQGGEGPEGSTLLTQTELTYHWSWYGLGTFFQYDKQGETETDIGFGPKIELHKGPFYLEGGYLALLKRSFTDRSIAEQTGNGWMFGGGVRFRLGATQSPGGGGFFLQFTYKYRIQNIKKQDSIELTEPIRQKDGYPLFGIGLLF